MKDREKIERPEIKATVFNAYNTGYKASEMLKMEEYADFLESRIAELEETLNEITYYASYCPADEKEEMLTIIRETLI